MLSGSKSRAPRIVHLIDSGGFFGAEQVVVTLAAQQADNGLEVVIGTIISPQDDGNPIGDVARSRNVPVVVFEIEDGLNRSGMHRILEWIDASEISVVHCHGYKANIFLGLSAPRNRPWRLVATLHGWVAGSLRSRLGVYEFAERMILRRFDLVCPVADGMVTRLPRVLRRQDRVRVIPNGIQIEVETERLPNDIAAFSNGASILVAIGRLSGEKCFSVLIDAFARLIQTREQICLVIVGAGGERDALARQIEDLDLAASVMLAGYRERPRKWLGHCAALVISSRTEGLPMVLLEALAAGLPVVSTRVGQIPVVAADVDIRLVDPGDARALCQNMADALEFGAEDELMRRRQQVVAQRFSAGAMAKAYDDAYAYAEDRAR